MKRTTLALTIGLLCGFATLVTISDVPAEAKKKKRSLTISQMMSGLVKPKYVAIKEGLSKESISEDDWKALATHAALLNESSYSLMQDDRCPDGDWKEGAMILRKASNDALANIAKENAAGALKAVESMTLSCKKCHAAHKQ
jgi:hypothetical protein